MINIPSIMAQALSRIPLLWASLQIEFMALNSPHELSYMHPIEWVLSAWAHEWVNEQLFLLMVSSVDINWHTNCSLTSWCALVRVRTLGLFLEIPHQPGHVPQCTTHGPGNMAHRLSGLFLIVGGRSSRYKEPVCFKLQSITTSRSEINVVG